MIYEPMKSTDIGGLSKVDGFVRDDKWVFEQKMDGTRGLAVVTHDKPVWWPGRGGRGALAHSAAIQHFPKINPILQRIVGGTPGELVLDGEIMFDTGEFHIFDCPYMRFGGVEIIRNEDPFSKRRLALESPDLIAMLEGTPVKIVRQASDARTKAALLDAVAVSGGEGVIAKNRTGMYQPGKRVGHQLKFKFVKSADVIVMEVNRPDPQHGSAQFGVWVNGTLTRIGACSLIGKPLTRVGDVIEVEYLSWTGSALTQPRMKRVRDDKDPMDCQSSQLSPYSKRAV